MKKKISKTKAKSKTSKTKSKVSKRKSKKKVSKRKNPRELPTYYTDQTRSMGYKYPDQTGQIKTLQEAKEILKQYEWSIIKNSLGQYEVYPIKDRNSGWAYESNNLTDAVMTGIGQARIMTNNLLQRKQYGEYYPSI